MRCPHRDRCGNCPWMELPADEQLRRKADRVARAAGRAPDAIHPSPADSGFRARISLRPGPGGRLAFSRPRSHEPVPVDSCPVAHPEISALLGRLPPLPGVGRVELRRGDGPGVVLAARGGRLDASAVDGLGLRGVALAPARGGRFRALAGDPCVEVEAGGVRHRLGPGAFFQVHPALNRVLVERVRDEVLARAPEAVLDLYAGAGNLGLAIAAAGVPVTLVERDGAALRDARATAARHGLAVRVRALPAERWRAGDDVFDVAVLDPPRAGAGGVLAEVLLVRPRAVVLVSCHPPALRRDLRTALDAGYRLARLEVLDLFPHTPHVEAMAVLERPA